jgi:hypothetical protein
MSPYPPGHREAHREARGEGEMKETKLCPMMKGKAIISQPPTHEYETFLFCIQERCAWWVRETLSALVEEDLGPIRKIIEGHCVALDWRKK